jgi:ABC-2 type transport system permease protein
LSIPRNAVPLLLRLRLTVLRNQLRQALHQRPLRLIGSIASLLLIWVGLYVLLYETLRQVRRPVLEGIVATPLIFTFFFLAMTGMLAFSNAILSYGGLFRRPESAYLVASPLEPRDVVIVKYLESLLLSSWSLILLGLPLMAAMARTFYVPWTFYPLFLALFLLFIPLPGALGLLLAWAAAVCFPKTPKRVIITLGVVLVGLAAWWMGGLARSPMTSAHWLSDFYDRVSIVQGAMLPHTWVSKGINHALQGQTGDALFYLFVTAAHAAFFSFAAVGIVTRGFPAAFDRAQTSGARGGRRRGRFSSWLSEVIFAYLPWRQRLLAAKDLKSLLRDPLQWSQMAILIGLLALYVSNVQRLWTDLVNPTLKLLIAFLNQTAVSLILATFTNRFVFPLVSLEGQQLWLLGLLPISRGRIIAAKFLYALTITLAAALGVVAVSVYKLDLSRPLAAAHLVSSVAVCVGLCGVCIGVGARMPVFHERNPARIAGGFGGTVSLLLSIALVVASLVGVGIMSVKATTGDFGASLTGEMIVWLGAVVALNVTAAAVAMILGVRHFKRVEC